MVIASPSESRCHLTLELRIPRPRDPKGEIRRCLGAAGTLARPSRCTQNCWEPPLRNLDGGKLLTAEARQGVCSVTPDANCCKRHTVSATCFSLTTKGHGPNGREYAPREILLLLRPWLSIGPNVELHIANAEYATDQKVFSDNRGSRMTDNYRAGMHTRG